MAVRSAWTRARVAAAAAVPVLIGAGLVAGGVPRASASTGHPAANTAPSGLYACASDIDDVSASCLAGAVADFDRARHAEGLGPMTLPSNYTSLTAPQQLLVLTNIDRLDRGLPAIAGLSSRLDALALTGANAAADPLPPSDLGTGAMSYSMGSNWASPVDPLWAEFLWVYDDGPGSGNIDCRTVADAGCWGHRDNVLAGYGPNALMGAATGRGGAATIYVDRDPQYRDVVYSWSTELPYLPPPTGTPTGTPQATGTPAPVPGHQHHLVVGGRPGRITGRPKVGKMLTAHLPGVHVDSVTGPAPSGVVTRLSWLRDGRTIRHAATTRYKIKRADRGHRIAFRAVFSGRGYSNTWTYTSAAVRVRR